MAYTVLATELFLTCAGLRAAVGPVLAATLVSHILNEVCPSLPLAWEKLFQVELVGEMERGLLARLHFHGCPISVTLTDIRVDAHGRVLQLGTQSAGLVY